MSRSANETGDFEEAARRRLLEAIDARRVADFSSLPEQERRLPAEILQRLLSGTDGERGAPVSALRIRGAHIRGPLLPPSGTGSGERAVIHFRECRFDDVVDLSGAEFLVLRFVDCSLSAFIGASIRVTADLDLSGSQFTGVGEHESELTHVDSTAVDLTNARIGGRLNLSSTAKSRFSTAAIVRLDSARIEGNVSFAGARLDGGGTEALSARSMIVGGNVDLKTAHGWRCEAFGELAFVAAQITGDLNCGGTSLSNPEGRALHCEDLRVESVFLTASDDPEFPFEARGRLNFLSAVVGGSLFMTNARLAPGPDYTGLLRKGGPIAINLQQARISNALGLRNIGALDNSAPATLAANERIPVQGWFLLTGTQVTSILDDVETGWPASGFLDLEGASYDRLRQIVPGEITERRIKWLRRQYPEGIPDAKSFRPQPYEQLSRVLRQHGQSREANAIAVEKIRMRLAARVERPWARVFPRLLMLVSHYGYSSSRAVLSFLVFVLLGAAMYATALFAFDQPFVPVESDPAPVTYTFAAGLLLAEVESGCPGLDVMHYALDAALPVIDLAQDLRCRFTPEGPFRWLWLLLHSLFVIAGAALSAIVILTLTGVMRQD